MAALLTNADLSAHNHTQAWLRVQQEIERYASNPVETLRVPALRANPITTTRSSNVAKRKKTHPSTKAARARKKGANKTKAWAFARGEITFEEAIGGKPKRKKKAAKKKTTAKRKKTAKKAAKKAKTSAKRAKKSAKRAKTSAKRAKKSAKRATKAAKTAKRAAKKTTKRKRKSKRKSKRSRAVTTKVERVVKVPRSRTQVVRVELTPPRQKSRSKKRKSKSKRKKNPTSAIQHVDVFENPVGISEGYFGGLIGNPNGPFSGPSLRGYGIAAGGVGAGLVIADFLDRFVATRTPADSEEPAATANHPWYGRDAAAAQRRRPDAMRLGAQAAGAVVSMALAYWTRNGNILPWLFGGTAVGFGANLLKQLTDWYVMPFAFKVDDPTEESFANRMFPLEQDAIQSEVDTMFENWATVPALLAGQSEAAPAIQSPLAQPGSGVYTLGKAGSGNGLSQLQPLGARPDLRTSSKRQFIGKPHMLGKRCDGCGGYGGCWADCSTHTGYVEADCTDCKQCAYVVQPGDDLGQILSASNTGVGAVRALNGGQDAGTFWRPGNRVVLPYEACMVVSGMPSNNGGVVPSQSMPSSLPQGIPAQSVPPATYPGAIPATAPPPPCSRA